MSEISRLFRWSVAALTVGLLLFALMHFPEDKMPNFIQSSWFYTVVCLLLLVSGLLYIYSFCALTVRGETIRVVIEIAIWLALGVLMGWFAKLFTTTLAEVAYYVLLGAAFVTVSRVLR